MKRWHQEHQLIQLLARGQWKNEVHLSAHLSYWTFHSTRWGTPRGLQELYRLLRIPIGSIGGWYIDTAYSKRSNFASDIDITPVRLSQVLNSHREPKDEFMRRLMIHSEKTYQNICQFQKKTWYQVYYHEKICDTISSQDEWRSEVEKHVKVKNLVNS